MSSLAATQADGYYLPVEYYESGAYKKKSKNQWWASKAESGGGVGNSRPSPSGGEHDDKKKNEEVVRFELPYDGVCEACQSYVKRGTRFNATKAKVGAYYSTPIYEFRMRCRACPSTTTTALGGADDESPLARIPPQEFVVRVNPSEFGFDYLSGIRKHQRDFVADPSDHCPSVEDRTLSRVEVLETQQQYAQQYLPSDLELLQKLKDRQSRRSFLDADGNAALRAAFRPDRQRRKRQLARGSAIGWRSGLELLEDSTVQELCDAKTAVYGDCRSRDRDKWRAIRGESIFSRAPSSKPTRRQGRRQPQQSREAIPDAVSSAARTNPSRRGGRKRTAEVVNLVEKVGSETRAVAPKGSDATGKKRRTLTVVATRTAPTASVPDSLAGAPVARAAASSIASLLASYDSSSSDT